ncbi:autotransporter outer membrane beta-barrel domain-containing protein [Sphingobium sp. JS3065]|uniref:autotransporter outer membrane beta-barrel domain-containing protein n=1 Tax=Sphingobium sp. JS3065 TaxID=2970925 RepID=UPI002264ADD5|nr:autotransporter outer membrane beta-barrel domain-containing protein [Sphingobium sp. JS3065]UZW57211.1 autotransporter outer membrane beta-barrel domain-containing protein [Sphingobium sp. JS3065]
MSNRLLPIRRLMKRAAALLLLTAQPALAGPYAPYAATPGEAAVGAMLDAIPTAPSSDRAAMLASIDALPMAAARADALGQLSPRSYSLLPRLSIQSMDAADREIRSWLAERRSIALDAPADVPVSGDRTITMMLTGGVKQATYKGRIDRPEAESDSRSLRFAIDVKPVRGLIVGATLGIDGIDARLDPAQRPRISQFNSQIGPYLSYSDGRFYADATASYTLSEYKLRRQIGWPGFTGRMVAPVDGDGWAASGEAGAMLRAGAFRLQPFAGLHYRYADVSGFTENGGPAALQVAPFRVKSLRGALGARLSANVAQGGWTLRPSVEAQWQRELRARPDSRIEARFATRDLPIFTLRPTRLARDAGLVNAALSATWNSRTTVRLGYAGEYSSDRHVHAATLTIGRRF